MSGKTTSIPFSPDSAAIHSLEENFSPRKTVTSTGSPGTGELPAEPSVQVAHLQNNMDSRRNTILSNANDEKIINKAVKGLATARSIGEIRRQSYNAARGMPIEGGRSYSASPSFKPTANDVSEVCSSILTPPENLAELAGLSSKYNKSRKLLAANAYTPSEALSKLSDAKEPEEIRVAAAGNSSLSREDQIKLSKDESPKVRYVVSRTKYKYDKTTQEMKVAELNACFPDGTTQATRAVCRKQYATLRELFKAGASPDAKDGGGFTPMLNAAHMKNDEGLESVKILFEYRADATIANNFNNSTIALAVDSKSPRVLKLLIDHDKDKKALNAISTFNGCNAVSLAADQGDEGNYEIMKILLDAGADRTIHLTKTDDAERIQKKLDKLLQRYDEEQAERKLQEWAVVDMDQGAPGSLIITDTDGQGNEIPSHVPESSSENQGSARGIADANPGSTTLNSSDVEPEAGSAEKTNPTLPANTTLLPSLIEKWHGQCTPDFISQMLSKKGIHFNPDELAVYQQRAVDFLNAVANNAKFKELIMRDSKHLTGDISPDSEVDFEQLRKKKSDSWEKVTYVRQDEEHDSREVFAQTVKHDPSQNEEQFILGCSTSFGKDDYSCAWSLQLIPNKRSNNDTTAIPRGFSDSSEVDQSFF